MKYIVIYEYGCGALDNLIKRVNKKIKDGYTLFGGIALGSNSVAQAMIKNDDKHKSTRKGALK